MTTGRQFSICTYRSRQLFPAISADTVVWLDDRNGDNGAAYEGDIYGYDTATRREFAVSLGLTACAGPDVSGDVVVWEDLRNLDTTGGDIYATRIDDQ